MLPSQTFSSFPMLPSHLVTPFGSCTLVGIGQPSSILYPVLQYSLLSVPHLARRRDLSGPREHLKPFGPTDWLSKVHRILISTCRPRAEADPRTTGTAVREPSRAEPTAPPIIAGDLLRAETSARLAPYLFRRGRPGAVPRLRSLGLDRLILLEVTPTPTARARQPPTANHQRIQIRPVRSDRCPPVVVYRTGLIENR